MKEAMIFGLVSIILFAVFCIDCYNRGSKQETEDKHSIDDLEVATTKTFTGI
jgi:hypothetical protein